MDNVQVRNELDATLKKLEHFKELAEIRLNSLKAANALNAQLERSLEDIEAEFTASESAWMDLESRLTAVTRKAEHQQAILGPLEHECQLLTKAYYKSGGLVLAQLKNSMDLVNMNAIPIPLTMKNYILRTLRKHSCASSTSFLGNNGKGSGVSLKSDLHVTALDNLPTSPQGVKETIIADIFEDSEPTCYYEVCGGGTSPADLGKVHKPLYDGKLLKNERKRRKTTMPSPDLGVPLSSTPYPISTKITDASAADLDKENMKPSTNLTSMAPLPSYDSFDDLDEFETIQ